MAQYTYTPAGVPVRQVTSYESFINIHPDHTGLIIGRSGSTIQKIQRDTGVDVLRIRKPNNMSGGMPWIQIRGHIKSVENAYQRVLTIAQEADRRIPRMGQRNVMTGPPVPPPPTHPTPTFQHPFGVNTSTTSRKPRPPPIDFSQDTIGHQSAVTVSEKAYQPHSPSYQPLSPEYRPNSPSYQPYSPRSPPLEPHSPKYAPRSPLEPHSPRSPLEPHSPQLPPAQENAPKKIKFKRAKSAHVSTDNTESS